MKSKALCYFQHKGIDYKKGVTVDLPEAEIKALAKAGLVELAKEVQSTDEKPQKTNKK